MRNNLATRLETSSLSLCSDAVWNSRSDPRSRPPQRPAAVLPFLLALMLVSAAAQAGVRRLGNTPQYGSSQINSAGQVVWQGGPGTNGEIFLWDGAATRTITGPIPRSVFPQINQAGQVLWTDTDGQDREIYLWDGTATRQLTDNTRDDGGATFNDRGQVAWTVQEGGPETAEIYLLNGSTAQRLTNNSISDRFPRINNQGQVVWEGGDRQIYFWDGAMVRQLSQSGSNSSPQVNNAGHVVWQSFTSVSPTNWEFAVLLWDGSTTRRIIADRDERTALRFNDRGQLVWWKRGAGGWQIELWDGGQVQQLPYQSPSNNGISLWTSLNQQGEVAWQSWDGDDWEIFLWSGGAARQLTYNQRNDFSPTLNAAGQITWISLEGEEWAAYLYTPVALSVLALEPPLVVGGRPVTGTVTLPAPAPAGGAMVTLASDEPSVAAVPSQVVVAAGATTATFPISTARVTDVVDVVLTASRGGESIDATLRVLAVGLESLSLEPATLSGGVTATGTVRLSGPAPASGAEVRLTSSNNFLAVVPATVSVPAGATTATFAVQSRTVASLTTVGITAVYGGTRTATLTVLPHALVSLAVSPPQVAGGGSATGTVTLNQAAPPGGLGVLLASTNALAATVPASVTIPAGAATATFPVTTRPVMAPVPVVVTASFGGAQQAATLTVEPSLFDGRSAVVQVLALPTNDIVYDPAGRKIWASVPGSAGRSGNSVVPIDPPTHTVGAPIFVGSEPGRLALSDNSQYLYVALDGASAIRRLDVAARAAGLQFPLVSDPAAGAYAVDDMEVVPGDPNALAVARRGTGGSDQQNGIVLFDNGVPRPRVARSLYTSHFLEFSASPSRLYSQARYHNTDGFHRLAVDAAGVTLVDTPRSQNPWMGSSPDSVEIEYEGGRIYSTSGRVFDPEALTIDGTFPEIAVPSLVAPDSARGRVYFLTGDGPSRLLRAFDTRTFLPVGTLEIDNVSGTASRLIRWGADGLAFRTSAGQLFLIRSDLVSATGPVISFPSGSVVGGRSTFGRVTLSAPAPEGSAVVLLASEHTAVTVPASVTVPAGETTATFAIQTRPVAAAVAVQITGSAGGMSGSGQLQVLPPALLSVAISPATVGAGAPARGTVTLSGPAPEGGIPVSLRSSKPETASVPETVTLPAGEVTAEFRIATGGVRSATTVQITASGLGASYSATVEVTPTRIASFTLDRYRVVGGEGITATVTLETPAPPGGLELSFQIENLTPQLQYRSVSVPEGATTVSFPIPTPVVLAPRTLYLGVWYGTSGKSAELELIPTQFIAVRVQPTSVRGGDTAQGTVELSGPAPEEGVLVALTSDRAAVATPPAAVLIPAGARSATFGVPTAPVSAAVSVTIGATGLGATRTTVLQVLPRPVAAAPPPRIASLSLERRRAPRGQVVRGSIRLSAPAPAGGVTIILQCNRPYAAHVPARLLVPAGTTTVTFPVKTYRVRRTTTVRLTAATGGSSRWTVLAVMRGTWGRR